MHVQVNTGTGITHKESLERFTADYLQQHLGRFGQDLTGVEIQLMDENSGAKGGPAEKRCMLEARVTGHPPIAVTHLAPDQDQAFRGAADKLARAIDHALGKLDRREHRDRDTIRRDTGALSE